VHPLVMDRPSDETGWSGLPGELLEGRLLSFHGPSELCRLAGVCRSWRVACTSRAADEGCWKKLCWAAFPTMAGKLEEDVAAAAAVAREVVGGDEKESSLPSMFWKEKFAQRHLKQLAWHAEKLGHRKDSSSYASGEQAYTRSRSLRRTSSATKTSEARTVR